MKKSIKKRLASLDSQKLSDDLLKKIKGGNEDTDFIGIQDVIIS